MATWVRPPRSPRRGAARVAPWLGLTTALLTAVLIGAVLLVRAPADPLSVSDLARIDDAVAQGCSAPARSLAEGTGFALDGTVVRAERVDRAVRLDLRVQEWFRGPPLQHVTVDVDASTARDLAGGGVPSPGVRLLVSGRGWGGSSDALRAAGCGRTQPWQDRTAADWREVLAGPAPVGPDGPAAVYPAAGVVRSGPPDLRGVLVLDGGCLYVHDGVRRWLPLLPADGGTWSESPPALTLDGVATDVGHVVRLGGLPAAGSGPGSDGVRSVAERGVPAGCDLAAPRFVVAERPSGPRALPVASGNGTVGAVADVATLLGLRPTSAAGGPVVDSFGEASTRVELRTEDGGTVLVHVESVVPQAWPAAYAPQDARLRRAGGPEEAAGLPSVPPGWELAVVDRRDGVTHVLLRTPGRVLVSASADVALLPADVAGPDRGVQVLTDLALRVAVLGPDASGG